MTTTVDYYAEGSATTADATTLVYCVDGSVTVGPTGEPTVAGLLPSLELPFKDSYYVNDPKQWAHYTSSDMDDMVAFWSRPFYPGPHLRKQQILDFEYMIGFLREFWVTIKKLYPEGTWIMFDY
jgi:hypothetical protein